jgi:hypothetical protein
MTDATLGPAVVNDLFGIRHVEPTSRFPNADVEILDGQQQNVVVVAVIKPVPPRNVVEILLDEVTQPPQVVVLPPTVRGRRAAADFLEKCHGFGVHRVAMVLSIAKKYLAPESSAAASLMSFRPLLGFHLLINLIIPSKRLRMIGLAEAPLKARPDVAILARIMKITQ